MHVDRESDVVGYTRGRTLGAQREEIAPPCEVDLDAITGTAHAQ